MGFLHSAEFKGLNIVPIGGRRGECQGRSNNGKKIEGYIKLNILRRSNPRHRLG